MTFSDLVTGYCLDQLFKREVPMGQHTVIAIPHDNMHGIERNEFFGEDLVKAILRRKNLNIPEIAGAVDGVQLGTQFNSHDTFFIFVQEGTFTHLSCDEQLYLENALRRLRKKKAKEQSANKVP